ncbi:MAG: HlyD family efflux transporter periplasmic adaptor subunit [Kangiellaceae bacterium]
MDRPLSESAQKSNKLKLATNISKWAGGLLILVLALHWLFSPSVNRSTLRTAVVEQGTITATVNAGGVVIPLIEETIASELETQLVKVIAQQGAKVSKGDVIMLLNPQRVELEVDNIEEKIALKDTQIQAKQLQLSKAVNDIDSRYELLEVDLQSRATRAERLNQLSGIGAFSKHELLESELNVKRTKIEMRQLKQSKQDLKLTTKAEIEGLNLEKSILQKSLLEQKRLLSATTVRASRDGVLTWLKNEEGASVTISEPLAKIADHSKFKIEATLSDFYSTQLTEGMSAQIYHDDKVIMGELSSLSPTIENGVMKIQVKLAEGNYQNLRSNQRVDVGLVLETIPQTMILPKGPYVSGRGLHQVFVIRDDNAFRTEVEIGTSNPNQHQIISGLLIGDEVIISDVKDYLHLEQFSIN